MVRMPLTKYKHLFLLYARNYKLCKWKKEGGAVPPDTVERLSHLLSIWKALQILFTSDQASDAWMHAPNDFFNGDSALDVMLGGKVIDIYAVRRYLDAQRGG